MNECPRLSTCPFFNEKMKAKPGTTEMYKSMYCQKDYEKCARYLVFIALGKEKVPANLYPNEVDRAKQIIQEG